MLTTDNEIVASLICKAIQQTNDKCNPICTQEGICRQCKEIARHLINNGVGVLPSARIDDLGLTARSYNALRRAGIQTLAQLRELTEEQLLSLPSIGESTVAEISRKLKKYREEGEGI